jgi:DNA polymerase elongation subunit (family B)
MSYIDALLDRESDKIHIVERDKNGKRIYQEYKAKYLFYYTDPKGKYRSVYGDSLSKVTASNRNEFLKELRVHKNKSKIFESDINPVFRCLSDNYLDIPPPKLHTCFFDIEVNFDPDKGFAPTDDPFNAVNSISLYLDWLDTLVTLCIPPTGYTHSQIDYCVQHFDNTVVCKTETEMFNLFFTLIEDADVLTGWNSGGYDIPYMVNRVTQVMSKDDTRRFCLFNQFPRQREFVQFDQKQVTYDLVGRVHMDYLELYKKYNYEQRHSYKLDYIGEMEVGEKKTQYEGTLDQLYNKDWKTFLEYNRQDTMLLFKIHDKLKFLDLANSIAHQNTVLLPTVMGSVAMIEQAVINEAHARGLIIPDKPQRTEEDETKAAGAYVAYPKKGIHEWIAAVDLNSLYPSTIRALNMAPETIIGQLRPTLTEQYMYDKGQKLAREKKKNRKVAEDQEVEGEDGPILWEGLFGTLEYNAVMNQERETMITIDWERGSHQQFSAAEIHKIIFDSGKPWMLSANGTIFTYEQEGVIPGLLTRWYSERKDIQKQLKEAKTKEEAEFYDKRQLVRKILLNSAYGALLNQHCRFYDKRIGQSTTLTGRQIVKHMSATLNELIAGEYNHTGEAIVYGDTDSCYFSGWPIWSKDEDLRKNWTKEYAIEIYDDLGNTVNSTFPDFMHRAFHCPSKNGSIIKAGRELVADRGLFITKKRYAVNIYDKEGKRLDKDGSIGKIKAMGLDLKRADTPKFVQEFLFSVLESVLAGATKEDTIQQIIKFKEHLRELPSWNKGSPKAVNKLTLYEQKLHKSKDGKVNMPGHVRASLNWNFLLKLHHDNYSTKITNGAKVIVCKLLDNALGFTSIAYPTDELRLPKWFTELPFDDREMEYTLVDKKIDNLLGGLGWNLERNTDINTTFNSLFTFE